jgi:hypothetical protein
MLFSSRITCSCVTQLIARHGIALVGGADWLGRGEDFAREVQGGA